MKRLLRLAGLSLAGVALTASGCGEGEGADGLCPGAPMLTLGTGRDAFEPLSNGQDLPLVRGIQGGCHVWLSLSASGIDGRRVTLSIEVRDVVTTELVAQSATLIRLSQLEDGSCGVVGFPAVFEAPWRLENRDVRLLVSLIDPNGVTLEVDRPVIIRWPQVSAGEDSLTACGPRS